MGFALDYGVNQPPSKHTGRGPAGVLAGRRDVRRRPPSTRLGNRSRTRPQTDDAQRGQPGIARLRQELETEPRDPSYLVPVHGVGYKFVN